MSKNKHCAPKKRAESRCFCGEKRKAFSRTSQTSVYGNTDRRTKNFASFLPGRRKEPRPSAYCLHSHHVSTCSDELNIPDSRNISGNLDHVRKYLKLAPNCVCRILTYVNLMKYNKSYARHRQTYKDAATSTDGNCVSCEPSIPYPCCNYWSA
jgi:hypothetical protein